MLAQLSNIFLQKDNSLVYGDYERAHILTHEEGKQPCSAVMELAESYSTKAYMRAGARGVEDPQRILSSLNRQRCSPQGDLDAAAMCALACLVPPGTVLYDDGGDGMDVLSSNAIPRVQICGNVLPAILGLGEGSTSDIWERETRLGHGGRQWYLPEGSDMNLVGYNLMTVKVAEMLGASKDLQHLNADISDSIPRVHDAFLDVMSPPMLPRKVRVLLCHLVTSGGDLDSMEPHKANSDRLQHLLGLVRYLVKTFPPPPLPFSPTEEALKPVYNATLSADETSAIVVDEQQCPPLAPRSSVPCLPLVSPALSLSSALPAALAASMHEAIDASAMPSLALAAQQGSTILTQRALGEVVEEGSQHNVPSVTRRRPRRGSKAQPVSTSARILGPQNSEITQPSDGITSATARVERVRTRQQDRLARVGAAEASSSSVAFIAEPLATRLSRTTRNQSRGKTGN